MPNSSSRTGDASAHGLEAVRPATNWRTGCIGAFRSAAGTHVPSDRPVQEVVRTGKAPAQSFFGTLMGVEPGFNGVADGLGAGAFLGFLVSLLPRFCSLAAMVHSCW